MRSSSGRLLFVVFVTILVGCGFRTVPRVNVLVPDGTSESVSVMDFRTPPSLDPVAPGWHHKTFWRHGPMEISFTTHQEKPAIRLATQDTASMLFRFLDVPVDEFPMLTWDWFIEQPIESDLDEMTVGGDDHPARIWLRFADPNGDENALEIVWGNQKLRAGDWKHLTFLYLFSFPHYVANGGVENAKRWNHEEVDLRNLYRELWGDPSGARLIEVALFCDTDETGASSIAYFADIKLSHP